MISKFLSVILVFGVTAIAALTAQQAPSSEPVFDLLVRNAQVYDGMGNPWIRADVGVHEGRIHSVGRLANA